MLMWAPDWNWIVAANVLLGINQGLAWSANVIMKIDLAGQKDRGLAMGLNEFAGYLAVAIVAFLTGWIATEFGLRPYPFYLGIGLAVAGLLMSIFLVRDTAAFVQHEASSTSMQPRGERIFWNVSWGRPQSAGGIGRRGCSPISKMGWPGGYSPCCSWHRDSVLRKPASWWLYIPLFGAYCKSPPESYQISQDGRRCLWSGLFRSRRESHWF